MTSLNKNSSLSELLNKKYDFPKVGDKLIFTGVPKFYYPCFTCMKARAERDLIVGQEYTVRKVAVYSSWCAVWLEGIGEEPDNFNIVFFKRV